MSRSPRGRDRRGRFGAFAIALSGVALLAVTPSNAGFRDSWAALERELAVFDPGGRYLTRPIERKVPRLALNGTYVLSSDVLLSGSDNKGFRDRDYRLLQFQNLFELEVGYQFSEGLQFSGIFHGLYDAVYSLEGADGLYAPKVDERFRAYEDSKDVVRELFISYRTLKLDVVLGKQQIAWGKMDGQFIDVINPIDNRESVQLESSDYERRRIPVWMANVTYYAGPVSLNFLWIPEFEADENPVYGSPWFSPLIPPSDDLARHNEPLLTGLINASGDFINTRSRPDWNDPSDHQLAFRIDWPVGAWTFGLIYFYAWDKNASESITGRFTDANGTHLLLERRHRRLHQFGFTSDYSNTLSSVPIIGTLPLVLRVEALLSKDVPFTDFAERGAALFGGGGDGLKETDTLRAAVAFEFAFPHNTTLIFQPSFYYTKDWRRSLGGGFGGAVGDAWALAPVIFLERPFRFTRDRLTMSATITPYISQPTRNFQGIKQKYIISYEFSQYIEGKLVYTDYSGGDSDDLFGQYRSYDNLGIEVQYEF
ncbi:MAG: hypothetical protein HKP27_03215 [Myxococcales bacterium]|nr:hypothetical protein [Myxococcales bacterium]